MKTNRPLFFEDYRVKDRIRATGDVLDNDGNVVLRRGACGTVCTSTSVNKDIPESVTEIIRC